MSVKEKFLSSNFGRVLSVNNISVSFVIKTTIANLSQ